VAESARAMSTLPRAPHQPPPRPISRKLGRQGATPSASLSSWPARQAYGKSAEPCGRAPSLRDGRRARRHSASALPCCASPVEVPAGGAAARRRRAVRRSRPPCRAAVAPFARCRQRPRAGTLVPGRAVAVEKGERPPARVRGEQPRRSSPRRCGRASRSCSRGVGRERRTAPGLSPRRPPRQPRSPRSPEPRRRREAAPRCGGTETQSRVLSVQPEPSTLPPAHRCHRWPVRLSQRNGFIFFCVVPVRTSPTSVVRGSFVVKFSG